MNERIENQENPFAKGDAEELRRLLVDLIPENGSNPFPSLIDVNMEHLKNAMETRFSELPPNTYRILECGSFSGFYYKLELNDEKIVLKHQQGGEDAEFQLFGDRDHAIKVARKVIGDKIGLMKADMARFEFAFGFEFNTSQPSLISDSNPMKTQEQNPNGLHQRYRVEKLNGKTDPSAEYFVLRLDEGGSDPKHIAACRKALMTYADEIETHLPELARDLREKYGSQPEAVQ